MHGSKQTLPIVLETPTVTSQQVVWGEMNVAIESFAEDTDPTELFKGLPHNQCQCPHWGYVIKGQLRIRYNDREEVITAGSAYYIEPGHIPWIASGTEVVEFSPQGAYQKTMDVVVCNLHQAPAA
jgi:mannose-6-phosphate isomerase-like protein (cupin superfamily)